MTILRAALAAMRFPARVPMGGRPAFTGGSGLLGGAATSGMDAYADVGAVYGAVRRVCEAVSLTNWSLYAQTETAGTVARELVDDAMAPARHPGTAIWTRPNDFMTRRFFLYLTQLYLEVAQGQCYWLIAQRDGDAPYLAPGLRSELELWPIRADRITPIPDPDKYLAGYVYTYGTEQIPLSVQSVVPLTLPDPRNPLRGLGPLNAVQTEVETDRYAAQYQRNVFLTGAEPGGVIEFETPLSPDRFEELVLRWREQHQGVSNARRVAILEGGKWVGNAVNNRDLEYAKLRELTQEQVMYAIGMPYAMMITRDVNLANATAGEKVFYRWTLRPRLELIKESLNERVLPYLGENLTMDYELPSPDDAAFDIYAGATGWLGGMLTKNEARAALGYDAVDGGDVYVTDLTGVVPPLPAAKPPRRPTTLSYRTEQKRSPQAPAHEDTLTAAWGTRLTAVRDQYLALLAQRDGGH